MKKIFAIFALVAMMFTFTSCREKSFIKTVATDFDEVAMMFPGTSVLCEVQCKLTEPVDVAEKAVLGTYTEVYQFCDTTNEFVAFRVRKPADDSVDTYTKPGIWVGSVAFNPNDIKLDITDAFKALKSADIVLPDTEFVTLRQPLDGQATSPMYIFGSVKTFCIGVDAITGEVKQLNLTDSLAYGLQDVIGPQPAEPAETEEE